jgi:transposase InsO family protein
VSLIQEAAKDTGVGPACKAIEWSRASFYRLTKPRTSAPLPGAPRTRKAPPRSLTPEQQEQIVAELNSDRFLDCAARQVWATLLDEGVYLCSWRTMYRLLHQYHEVRERRKLRRHCTYSRPELAASGPNQVWTWDITYLKGPVRGLFFYLYVVIDLFSRLVVGWMLADRECAELGCTLLEKSYRKHGVKPGQLTVHADRGAPMKSKTLKQLLSDLDVETSHSRPRVSNDNPFSEAGFKTMKYSPDFPARFESFEAAEAFCQEYFVWYNQVHRHTGIALLTPAQVHYGEAEAVLARRQATMDEAFARTPERFGYRRPQVSRLAETVWINRPAESVCEAAA